jgi:beta-glucosidase
MTQVTLGIASKDLAWGMKSDDVDMNKLRTAVVKYKVGSIMNIVNGAYTVDKWNEVIHAIQDLAMKETPRKIPVLYGIDSIHGANYISDSTLFPQNIGMAASFNPELVKKEAAITAYEMRAAGIPWNFAPTLDVGRQPMWSRVFETYGEDPYLVSVMSSAYVKGLEGENNAGGIAKNKAASCLKHFLGYSIPLSGKDRTPAWLPERMLREYFLPPFSMGVSSGAHTLMINSTEINGIPVHASSFYLKKILREELGFEGPAVSDWMDIKNLHQRSRVASSHKEAVKIAVLAGVDMSMVPDDFSFFEHLLQLVKEGEVPEARIDEAVERILMVKYKLGLFENPYPDKRMKEKVGCREFAGVALEAARQSITLLKNNGVLPLPASTGKILVTGPNADDLSHLNGGWTYTWDGKDVERYPRDKDTILGALKKKFSEDKVIFAPGCKFDTVVDIERAVEKANEVDVVVACLGEDSYAETSGILDDLSLPGVQLRLFSALAKTGKPVILVLTQGRPRLINQIADKAAAIVMAYLPGNEGGQAIADVLAGQVNPSGKLPFTYPRSPNDLKCSDYKYSEVFKENKFNPQFPFGFGLSYTDFAYENLTLDKEVMGINDTLWASVTVTNKGKAKGKEAVLLYLSDHYASITPPVKRLKRFRKVELAPGETKTVVFQLNKEDLSFIGRDNKPTVEPGTFTITVETLKKDFLLDTAR